jgi:hypothetical protein
MVLDPGSEFRDPRYGIRDPRSGIRDQGSKIRKKPIPDIGSGGQKGTGSWTLDSDPQHRLRAKFSSHWLY